MLLRMKDLLVYLLQNIVENVEAMSVEEKTEGDKILLVIHLDQQDIGKVIGKHGRVIRALRDVIKIAATKQNIFVDVTIAE